MLGALPEGFACSLFLDSILLEGDFFLYVVLIVHFLYS